MPDFTGIADLHYRHAGEEAWIFGKGPSLDRFDPKDAGTLRICINESVLHVPEPTYFFAHDEPPIQRATENWPRECMAILQRPRAVYAVECQLPVDQIRIYEKLTRDRSILDWEANRIADKNTLFGQSGTVHSALHFCKLIGVSGVVFVGFDGDGGYASVVGLPTPKGGGQHARIRRDSEHILNTVSLPFRYYSG